MTVLQALGASTIQTVDERSFFILDAPCFQDLQRYLDVAINLPSTEKKFNQQFNTVSFRVYSGSDKELCKALQDKLVEISEHCGAFQNTLIPAMLLLARGIALFVTDSNKRYAKIRGYLTTVIANGASLVSPNTNDAITNACDELDQLATRTNGRKFECEALTIKLTNFQRTTVTDRDDLSRIHGRFVQVIPGGVSVSTLMNTMLEESLAECENTGDAASAKQKGWGDGRYGMSAALLNFLFPRMEYIPTRTFDEIERAVENHINVYQAALAKHDLLGESLENSLVQVKALTLALTTICQTIDNSLKCIQGLISVYVDMGTRFNELSEQLKSINSATTKPNVEDCCREIWEEFEDPPTLWFDIAKVAADFARNGNLFEDKRLSKKGL